MVQNDNISARLFKFKKKDKIFLLIDKLYLQLPIFYFYFFVFNREFYVLLFGQQKILESSIFSDENFHNVQEIVRKKRLIRSFNGLFNYVVEMQQQTELFKLIKSNFPIGFWENIIRILKRRQKDELKLFLIKCLNIRNEYTDIYKLTNKDLISKKQCLILKKKRLILQIKALDRLISKTKI